jgi:F-type H+-transporting ATPase subunit b
MIRRPLPSRLRLASALCVAGGLLLGATPVWAQHEPLRPNPHGGLPGQIPPGNRPPVPPGTRPSLQQFPAQPVPRTVPVRVEKEEHHGGGHECPGHGPNDPPHHINYFQGIIGVNNEKAQQDGFLNKLLWRYHNKSDPCDEKNQPPPLLASVLNFGLLVFILYRFGRKPLSEALVKRKQSIMGEIENATRLKKEARARLVDYEERFEKIEETLAALTAEHAAQSEREKKHILAEAEERRLRMRRDAEFRIEQEIKAARIELLHEAVDSAIAAAEELIQKRVSEGDIQRMADDYLSSVSAALSTAGKDRAAAPIGGRS